MHKIISRLTTFAAPLPLLLLPTLVGLPAYADPGLPPAPLGAKPFFWGVAMSDVQNDGFTKSMDWYKLEESDHVPDRAGKGPDFRSHMDADLDRAQSLGINAFRTTIEWARLEPTRGHFDSAEVAYLHRLLDGIRKRGMTPLITLHHFATPIWADGGDKALPGWENPKTVVAYEDYVDFVLKEFGSQIDYYFTFNEPSTLLLGGYMAGMLEPHERGPLALQRASANILKAHIGAYERIHASNPHAMVSIPDYNCFLSLMGADGFEFQPGKLLASWLPTSMGWDGHPRVKYLDFVGVHFYGSQDLSTAGSFPIVPYRWGVRPGRFLDTLRDYYSAFHLPIMVAENGLATENGAPRADGWNRGSYVVAHVQALEKARQEGIPVFGYLYWTLTDNYEWGTYAPRYGLWTVNVKSGDLTRHETPAVAVYRDIILHNGVTPALARRNPPPPNAPWR